VLVTPGLADRADHRQPESAVSASDRVTKIARLLPVLVRLFLVALGIASLSAAALAVRGILAYGDLMYTDVVLVHAAMRVRDGVAIYPDVSQPPFLFLHYGPLYPAVVGLLSRCAQLDLLQTVYLARALSAALTGVAAASIAGLSILCGARRTGALVAAGLFITAYVIHPWAYVARTDLPALAGVLLGMYVLLRWPTWPAALTAGLLMAAGFESKQTYVMGFGATLLVLLYQRQWTRAAALTGAWSGTIALVALVMTPITNGRYLEQAVGNNLLPYHFETIGTYAVEFLRRSPAVIGLAAVGARGLRRAGPAPWTVAIYAILAGVTGFLATARMGSSFNYLIELMAALTILAGVGFDRIRSVVKDLSAPTVTTPARHLLGAASLLVIAVSWQMLPILTYGQLAAASFDDSALIQILQDAPGPVLTERNGLDVMLAGKEPLAGDPIGIASIAIGGRWDPAPLHSMIQSQAFALVALNQPAETILLRDNFPWWPPGTLELIAEHYRLAQHLGDFYFYVPIDQ